MFLNPVTPCLVFLWPSVMCGKPGNYGKEWKRKKTAPVVSQPTDAPSTLLTSSCHFPLTTEVWNRIVGDPGVLPSRVCVCVCVCPPNRKPPFSPSHQIQLWSRPPTRVCLLWVLRRLHKDWPAHRWQVSTAHLIPGCITRAQALDRVVLARGNRPMAENTDLGTRLVGLLTKWMWNPNEGREEVFSICGSMGHSDGKESMDLPDKVDTKNAGWRQAKWEGWNINLWKYNFPFSSAHLHEPGLGKDSASSQKNQ